jgi:hypothetical protein
MKESKLEKVEENKFVRKCESRGWPCIKLATQGGYGRKGYNDRLVLAPFGTTAVFEFKRIGEVARKLQDYRHRRLARLSHNTYVIYSSDAAFKILKALVKAAKAKATLEKSLHVKDLSSRVRKIRRK